LRATATTSSRNSRGYGLGITTSFQQDHTGLTDQMSTKPWAVPKHTDKDTGNDTGGEFVVVNTHLDNSSENARRRGASLIRDRITAIPAALPVILTGDFNSAAGHSAAYRILSGGAGLTDTWTAAAQRRTPLVATWHGYEPLVPDGPRIDWILTRGAARISAAGINTFTDHGRYASDHLPTQALLTLDHPPSRSIASAPVG
ncbi:MAG: endonuclease/exonuclease/phosphatase family protein, partial [Actinophytocola sp.]|uniref:endonuclease/exonuclease/phosphatase family protein n=1 Tax=Actinophytocola sp. TaxID=1872138 RepID=UPI003D6AFA31